MSSSGIKPDCSTLLKDLSASDILNSGARINDCTTLNTTTANWKIYKTNTKKPPKTDSKLRKPPKETQNLIILNKPRIHDIPLL